MFLLFNEIAVSIANNNFSEEKLQQSEEAAQRQSAIGFEPLDELLAHSKTFADYVATLASEE